MRSLALLALFAVAGCGSSAPSAGPANVGLTLDRSATRNHEAPSIAVDPRDPRHVAVSDVELLGGRCVVHVSADGGRTWTETASPLGGGYVSCKMQSGVRYNAGVSTALAFDANGSLLFAYSAAQPRDGDNRSILLSRSADGGKSWSVGVVYRSHPVPGQADVAYLPAMALDPAAPGRLYVLFARTGKRLPGHQDQALAATSEDGGKTFSAPSTLPVTPAAVSLAVSRGDLLAAYQGGQGVFVARSSDRGRTFAAGLVEPGALYGQPAIAADAGSGRVVLAWARFHGGTPGPRKEVVTRTSPDGGRTWGPTTAIRPTRPGPGQNANQLSPALSFASDGTVDAIWYDYENDPGTVPGTAAQQYEGNFSDLYGATSKDGARTFGPATRLTDHIIDRRIGTWNGQYALYAPPAVRATGDGYYAAWSDTRRGNFDNQTQDIFFTRRSVAGPRSTGPTTRTLVLGAEVAVLVVGLVLLVVAVRLRSRRRVEARGGRR